MESILKTITPETWESEKERYEVIISENLKRKNQKIFDVRVTDKPYQKLLDNNIVETHIPVFVKVRGNSNNENNWKPNIWFDLLSSIVTRAVWANQCGVRFEGIVDEREKIDNGTSEKYYFEEDGQVACMYFDITYREYAK